MQQGTGAHEVEFGGGGGKATRRKGRDMERALARGDLGALGSEVRTNKTVCCAGVFSFQTSNSHT